MSKNVCKSRRSSRFKILSSFIVLNFIINVFSISFVHAQSIQTPSTLINPSEVYSPAIIQGINVYLNNPLMFDFVVDSGDDNLQGEAFKKESTKLVKYFLAALTVPEDELWVNLSPYEKSRIIPDNLGLTDMGRDMLDQDYLLKQITASLMYPENELGEMFWQKIYAQVQDKYNIPDMQVDTFNKVWIVPDKAVVYEHETGAYVTEMHLKVMLQEDYVALEKSSIAEQGSLEESKNDKLSSDTIRELILPEIEKEVNTGKHFAVLRQIYSSMILATWYKKALKESFLGKVYVNKNKVQGVDIIDKSAKLKIYDQYVSSFKEGVYNYIKEEYDAATNSIIPRKYFSGGLVKGVISQESLDVRQLKDVPKIDRSILAGPSSKYGDQRIVTVSLLDLGPNGKTNTFDMDTVDDVIKTMDNIAASSVDKEKDVLEFLRNMAENDAIALSDFTPKQTEQLFKLALTQFFAKSKQMDSAAKTRSINNTYENIEKSIKDDQAKTLLALDMIASVLFTEGTATETNAAYLNAAETVFLRIQREAQKASVNTSSLDSFYRNVSKDELAVIKEGSLLLHRISYFIAKIKYFTANELQETDDATAFTLLQESIDDLQAVKAFIPASEPILQQNYQAYIASSYIELISVALRSGKKMSLFRNKAEEFINTLNQNTKAYLILNTYLKVAGLYEDLRTADSYAKGEINADKVKKTLFYSKMTKKDIEGFRGKNYLSFFRAAAKNSDIFEQTLESFRNLIDAFAPDRTTYTAQEQEDPVAFYLGDIISMQLFIGDYDQAFDNFMFLLRIDKNTLLANKELPYNLLETAEADDSSQLMVLFSRMFSQRKDDLKATAQEFIVANYKRSHIVANTLKTLYAETSDPMVLDTIFMLGGTLETDQWLSQKNKIMADIAAYKKQKAKPGVTKKQITTRWAAMQGIKTVLLSKDPDVFDEMISTLAGTTLPEGDLNLTMSHLPSIAAQRTVDSLWFLTDLNAAFQGYEGEKLALFKSIFDEETLKMALLGSQMGGYQLGDGLVMRVDRDANEATFEVNNEFKIDNVDPDTINATLRNIQYNGQVRTYVVETFRITPEEEKKMNSDLNALEQLLRTTLEKVSPDSSMIGDIDVTKTRSALNDTPVAAETISIAEALNKPEDQEIGGIDFNPALLDMQIKRDEKGIPLDLLQQPIDNIDIQGFIPIIINIKAFQGA